MTTTPDEPREQDGKTTADLDADRLAQPHWGGYAIGSLPSLTTLTALANEAAGHDADREAE